jgi:hypothetical protein
VTVANAEIWAAALEGLELQKARIEERLREVRALMGKRGPGRIPAAAAAPAAEPVVVEKTKRRTMSAAARRRIAAAQKKRWAEFRKKQTGS